jgi:TonB-dependent receptor
LPYNNDNVRTFNTDLDITSAYLMFRFDGANLAGELPIRGNVGVRYVETKRDVKAYTESELLIDGELQTSAKFDFTDTLPSINVIWDIREDLMLRAAYYETIVRPNANSFSAASSVDVDPNDWQDPLVDIDNVDIELGNPYLLPFSADAWDISLEWYNRQGSGVSVAYFQKDIVNGIEDRTLCPASLSEISQLDVYDFSGIVTGQLAEVGGLCLDEAGVEILIEDEINNVDGFTIDGWEIGVLQNFDFLDNWMRGFGIRANLTKIDASEGPDFDASGNRLPLENVSETTYNIIGYYDAEDWGVRLAYRNRSEYFLESTGTFGGEDRFVGDSDRLDLSASWRPMENLSVRAEIFNLTDETRIEYQGIPSRVRDLRYTGRTYTVGLKYRF